MSNNSTNVLHSLLDYAVTHLYTIISIYSQSSYDLDAILIYYCALLRDYSDYHLATLSSTHIINIYITLYQYYAVLDKRLRMITYTTADTMQITEQQYESELYIIFL